MGPVRTLGSDPYKSFRFRLKSDGHAVAGFVKCTGLTTSATTPTPIRLERGVTRDHNFASWIAKPAETWGTSKRKDLVVEIYNEAGGLTQAYVLNDCWVTKFQGIANLDANSNDVAIETLELDHHRRVRTS
jgi:phage tail-like protein